MGCTLCGLLSGSVVYEQSAFLCEELQRSTADLGSRQWRKSGIFTHKWIENEV